MTTGLTVAVSCAISSTVFWERLGPGQSSEFHQGDEYLKAEPVKKMSPIAGGLFLVSQDFGEVLLEAKMKCAREFDLDCRRFLDRLVDKNIRICCLTGMMSSCLICLRSSWFALSVAVYYDQAKLLKVRLSS